MSSDTFLRTMCSYGVIGLGYAAVAPRIFPISQQAAAVQATAFLVGPVLTRIADLFSLSKDTKASCIHGLVSFVAIDFASRYVPISWMAKCVATVVLTAAQWVSCRIWESLNEVKASVEEVPSTPGKYYVAQGQNWQVEDFAKFLENLRDTTKMDFVVAGEGTVFEAGTQVVFIDYWGGKKREGDLPSSESIKKKHGCAAFTYVIASAAKDQILPKTYEGAKVVLLQHRPGASISNIGGIDDLKEALGVRNAAPVRRESSNVPCKYYVIKEGRWRDGDFEKFLKRLCFGIGKDFVVAEEGQVPSRAHVIFCIYWGRSGGSLKIHAATRQKYTQNPFTYVVACPDQEAGTSQEPDGSKVVRLKYNPIDDTLEGIVVLKQALGQRSNQ